MLMIGIDDSRAAATARFFFPPQLGLQNERASGSRKLFFYLFWVLPTTG